MENYYDLFEVSVNSSFTEIIMSYENKITKFNNIKKLNKNQIKEIKLLKAGLYVLTDNNLRKKYNSFINKKFNYNELTGSASSKYNEPSAPNQDEDMNSNLDDLFKVDNTWMGNIDEKIGDKKEKLDSNMLSSRIFSMSELNNRPNFPSDFESELRKPQQGRPDKSTTN